MKAKAGIFLMLIGMMCFTGFGQTTSDLPNNSTAEVTQLSEKVTVVKDAPVLVAVFQIVTPEGVALDGYRYVQGDREFICFRESAKTKDSQVKTANLCTEQFQERQGETADYLLKTVFNQSNLRTIVQPRESELKNTGGRLSLFYGLGETYNYPIDIADLRSGRYGLS